MVPNTTVVKGGSLLDLRMFRLTGIVLFLACPMLQLSAQTLPISVSASETPTPTATKSDYPLDAFTEFSAIMIGSVMEMGEGTAEAYIYRSGNLMRMSGPEGRGYMITDVKSLETWGMTSGPCMYDKHPYFRAAPFAAMRAGSNVERVDAGKDTVDGHSTKIEEVTITTPDVLKPLKLRLWEADDLQGFPIKIEFVRPGGKNTTVRYRNIVLGPQDPTLFIHPKKCTGLPQASMPAHGKTTATKKPATSSK
jgi:hypothetical protein